MSTISLPITVSFLVAFIASFSRIFAASKPFWNRLPAWFQLFAPQLALALGAVAQGLAGGIKDWTDLTVVFVAAGALLLPGLPSNRSSAPVKSKPSIPPLVGLCICLMLALSLSGCAFFESKLPAAEACAPTPAALAAQVADILAAGGDYTAALEQLALKDTEAAVTCAVEAFLGGGKVGASASDAAAKERAQAYLKAKGVK